jgi:hypothetical protein
LGTTIGNTLQYFLIDYILIKIEEAGEEGRVQEAQILTKEVETLQKDLDFLKNVSIMS